MLDISSDRDTPGTPYQADWSPWARRLAIVVLAIALVFVAVLLRSVLSLAIIAFILAYLLAQPARLLARRTRLSYTLAVLLVALAYVLIVVLVLAVSAVPLVRSFTSLAESVATTVDESVRFLQNYTPDQGWLTDEQGRKTVDLNFVLEPLSVLVQNSGSDGDVQGALNAVQALTGAISGTVGAITGLLGELLVVHLLALFFLLDAPLMRQGIASAIPERFRRESGILATRIGRVWNSFMRATLLLAILAGVLNGLIVFLLGIPSAAIVGLLTGLFSLVPILGGILTMVTLTLVALVQGSATLALSPIALALVALALSAITGFVVWNIIFPKLAGNAVSLPITVIVLGVLVGGAVGGILGTLLATPVLGIARELLTYVIAKIEGGDPFPGVPAPAGAIGPVDS